MNDDLSGNSVDFRPAEASDAIDGVRPARVAVPHDAPAVAGVLAHASQRGLQVVVRGGGTKLGWGRPPAQVDLLLDMRRLTRVLQHERGDLTVTVEAGITLGALNDALRPAEQWLPLDPPFARAATIGGLLATNDSGPHRHRFGTPRDLVIGVQLATGEGVLASAGGRVVKNVAGYDLSKLVSGSFGELAVVVGATFKLTPLAAVTRTVVLDLTDSEELGAAVTRTGGTHLEPAAFELHVSRGVSPATTSLCLRFASVLAAAEAQAAAAADVAAGARVLSGRDEDAFWDGHHDRVWQPTGAVLRASWLPADLPRVLHALEQIGAAAPVELIGRAAVGAGLIRIGGDSSRQADTIRRLRAGDPFGHVTLVRGSSELKRSVDVWPSMAQTALARSVKRALDPAGILGARRGPVG